jgi:hypothetical protein
MFSRTRFCVASGLPLPDLAKGLEAMTEQTLLGIRAACYTGYRSEEEPRRIFFDGRTVEVLAILDRWVTPGYRYFKVCGDDGYTYLIRRDESSECRELTLFDRQVR